MSGGIVFQEKEEHTKALWQEKNGRHTRDRMKLCS